MTEQKHDILTETGRHRAWIGERLSASAKTPVRPTVIARDLTRTAPVRAAQPTAKANSRHAAITKGLQNFPSYKTWAEKAKTKWREDSEESK